MGEYYQKEVDEVLSALQSSKSAGLSDSEVKKRQENGKNTIEEAKKVSPLKILLLQFKSYIVWILGIAALITYLIDEYIEFFVILFIIIFIILLNFVMEFTASKSMAALLNLTPKTTTVLRNNIRKTIPSEDIVVGDIIVLHAGGIIPADARLIEASELKVDESALTGESEPVQKQTEKITGEKTIAEQINIVFGGTAVTNGHGLAIVTAIGKETEFGKISMLLQNVKTPKTLFQKRIDKLTKQLSLVALITAIFIFGIGVLKGFDPLTMVVFSMAVIVAGIPESLPTVVAITLANGVRGMAKKNAIVKKLPAVETLGTCTVICSDKTGTITQNKMVVQHIFTHANECTVTGEGYIPEGSFYENDLPIQPQQNKILNKLFHIGILCNDSHLAFDKGEWVNSGEATEVALLTLSAKAKILQKHVSHIERLQNFPFNSARKKMSVIIKDNKSIESYVKGAPEFVLESCTHIQTKNGVVKLNAVLKQKFKDKCNEYAARGLRVLALAHKPLSSQKNITIKQAESGLILTGIVAIRDPPEPSARDSVLKCQTAGIKVVMITGDNEVTAKAIATEVGIYNKGDLIITGHQLNEYDEDTLISIIEKVSVFARVTPSHKLKIVETFQKKGHIVAMTGDGVNDAPALKKSDIGIAMGKTGTDVAKESAELVLKDDNFSTIVTAVEQGRTIYDNVRKFIYYLLVGNFSILLILLISGIVGVEILPLTALMVLFINLAVSEFPSIGLSFEKPSQHIMKQKPRNPKEGILNPYLLLNIVSLVPLVVLTSILLYTWSFGYYNDAAKSQTLLFVTLILFMIFHALNAKSWNESFLSMQLFMNPWLIGGISISLGATILVIEMQYFQDLFGTVSLTGFDWMITSLAALTILFMVEFKKILIQLEITEMQKMDIHPTRNSTNQ